MGKDGKKRKRTDPDDNENNDIDARLAAYGERFMQMFEPTEVDRRKDASEDSDSDNSSDGSSDSSDYTGGSSSSEDDDDMNDAADAEVEHIFNSKIVVAKTKKAAKVTVAPNVAPMLPADVAKLERKRFMSHKAGVVSGAIPISTGAKKKGKSASDEDEGYGGLTKQEFQKLTREVHLYGASALDKKSKKKFDAAMLEQLGAKKAKGVKVPAKIGLGMAKKQAKREAAALEEAIAAGMVKAKGMGKKKRAEKRASLDRGLMEDGGAFKGGVLKVKGKAGGGGRANGGKFKKGGSRR